MDWPIKKEALDRWNALAFDLYSGPVQFDPLPVFRIFDDFIFLRSLQDRWSIEWIAEPRTGLHAGSMAWSEEKCTNRGSRYCIYLATPTTSPHSTVQEVLDTILHEMSHALLAFACKCPICTCQLNSIQQEGVTAHSPNWRAVSRCADETASLHLKGFAAPYWTDFRKKEMKRMVDIEEKAKVKILGRLSEKIREEGTDVAHSKKAKRAKARARILDNTPENDEIENIETETLASIVIMFKMDV